MRKQSRELIEEVEREMIVARDVLEKLKAVDHDFETFVQLKSKLKDVLEKIDTQHQAIIQKLTFEQHILLSLLMKHTKQ